MRLEIRIINEVKKSKGNKKIEARTISPDNYELVEYLFHRFSPYGIDKQDFVEDNKNIINIRGL